MLGRRSIQSGMIVRASDRSRLGIVAACGTARLYLRRGLLNPERYAVPYSEIAELTGEVILRRGRDSLIESTQAAATDGPITHTKPIFSLPEPAAASAQS
jgi:hypothetical protein